MTFFPLIEGCSEGLGCVQIFLLKNMILDAIKFTVCRYHDETYLQVNESWIDDLMWKASTLQRALETDDIHLFMKTGAKSMQHQ